MVTPGADAGRLPPRGRLGVLRELLGRPSQLHAHRGPQPAHRRPGRPAPRGRRGAAGGERGRGARGEQLSFEETGAYRLLLPAVNEDPTELQGFFDETVAPLAAYDEQYETELVRTLETFLDNNGNVARTAEQLFTHRHTIRYRLDRARELTGLDVSSTDGRERLVAGPEGDARAGHRASGRPGARAGRRGGPGALAAEGPLRAQAVSFPLPWGVV